MAYDLTNSNISDTFQHLLQVRTDDKTIYDALGNTLDEFRLSGSFSTSEFFEIEDSDSVTGNKLHSRAGTLYWGGTNLETASGSGVSNIVEDSTPQLGGELDLNNFSITGLTSTASLGRIEMAGHIVPNTGETYDLGSATKPFRDLHISSGSIKMYAGAEEIGRIMISDDDEFEFFNTKYLNAAQKLNFTPSQIRANAQRGKFRGKNIGDDLAEGKPTLPLIYAMDQGSAAERNMIREAIETGDTQNLTSIQLAIESSGGLKYTTNIAQTEVHLAIKQLESLPKSRYKEGLRSLAMFALNRRF